MYDTVDEAARSRAAAIILADVKQCIRFDNHNYAVFGSSGRFIFYPITHTYEMNELNVSNSSGPQGAAGAESSPVVEVTVHGVTFERVECRFSEVVGKWVTKCWLGDERKATRKTWAKKLTAVDPSQKGGYAFQGDWLRRRADTSVELAMSPGEIVIACVSAGSWRHPGQRLYLYYCDTTGIWRAKLSWWGESEVEDAETVHKIAEIFQFLQKRGEEDAKLQ